MSNIMNTKKKQPIFKRCMQIESNIEDQRAVVCMFTLSKTLQEMLSANQTARGSSLLLAFSYDRINE